MADSAWVQSLAEGEFEQGVLARSAELPVVVDFWAPWCGPCRSLGPLLERLAEEHAGAFLLAKINVDEAQGLAQQFSVRSIPTVLGFWQGKVAGEFVGAQPEAEIRRFLAELIPGPAFRLAREGAELAAAGHSNAAEERFRAALVEDPKEASALLGLARVLAENPGEDDSRRDEALGLLEDIPFGTPEQKEAERVAASIRTGSAGGDVDGLRERVEAAPEDLAARLELGRALASEGEYAEALEAFLEVTRRDLKFSDEAARKAMLDLFEVLGSSHELTEQYRSELARLLFR